MPSELKYIDDQLEQLVHEFRTSPKLSSEGFARFLQWLSGIELLFTQAREAGRPIFTESGSMTGHPAFIAGLIQKCGVLATKSQQGAKNVRLNVAHMGWLLWLLITQDSKRTQPKHLSMIINAMGKLAEADLLVGVIPAGELQESFHRFTWEGIYDSQAIAMGLFGVAQLAAKGHLIGQFQAENLTPSLARLSQCYPMRSQHISSSFKGLAQLALAKGLSGKFAAKDLISCLNQLMQCDDCDAQSIGMSLQALGHLAAEQAILGHVTIDVMVAYFDRLQAARRPDGQGMSMSLHGLGQLAEAGCLHGKLSVRLAQNWLNTLSTFDDYKLLHSLIGVFAMGQLAVTAQLEGQFEASAFYDLFEQLRLGTGSSSEIGAKELGNLLGALGRLAKAGALGGSFRVEQLEVHLKRILQAHDVDAQAIKMAFLGLAQLAEVGALTGRLPFFLLHQCTTKLMTLIGNTSTLTDYQEQHLSNSMYALGLFATNHVFVGQFSFHEVHGWLKKLLTLPHLSAQAIAMSFQGIELMATSEHLTEGVFEADDLKNHLNLLLGTPAIKTKTQAISTTFHALAQLVKVQRISGRLDGSGWHNFLHEIIHDKDLDNQSVSVFLYALGGLALMTDSDEVVFDIDDMRQCFQALTRPGFLDAQALSNSLFGISGWVSIHGLEGRLTALELKSYLDVLMTCADCNPLAIGLCLYALGELAERGVIEGEFDIADLKASMIELVNSSEVTKSHFSMAIYGLGKLAAEGQLMGHIHASELQSYLEIFAKSADVDMAWLGIYSYSLGNLASMGVLAGQFSLGSLEEASTELLSGAGSQIISMYFYGLSQVASVGLLSGKIDISKLAPCLIRLINQHEDLEAQHISIIFYALGQLAKEKQLNGEKLNGSLLHQCLTKLLDMPYLHAQAISNSLYGLAQLAEEDWLLPNTLDLTIIQSCFDSLIKAEAPSAQAINNALFSLKQFLIFKIWTPTADAFISLAETLKTLNQMVKAKEEPAYRARNAVLLVAAVVEIAPEATDLANPSQEVQQILIALISLGLSGNYVHPSEAAQMVHAIIGLGRIHQAFDGLLQKALQAITVPFTRLALPLQEQLQADAVKLTTAHPWYRLLQAKIAPMTLSDDGAATWDAEFPTDSETDSSSDSEAETLADDIDFTLPALPSTMFRAARTMPRAANPSRRTSVYATSVRTAPSGPRPLGLVPKIKQEAMEDIIFEKIFAEDAQGLKTLLGLLYAKLTLPPPPSRKRERVDHGHSDAEKRQRTRTGIPSEVPRLKRDASGPDKLVRDFFAFTPSKALIALVEQRDVDYFCWLLRACSIYQRYQLAINHDLHLLLIHLPIKNLGRFISELIKPCHIYVNHRALLAVLDAMNLRFLKYEKEQADIRLLQQSLLNEGLRHHAAHKHVASRLEQEKKPLDRQEITLWYEDVDSRMASQQQRLAQQTMFHALETQTSDNQTKISPAIHSGKPAPGFAIRGRAQPGRGSVAAPMLPAPTAQPSRGRNTARRGYWAGRGAPVGRGGLFPEVRTQDPRLMSLQGPSTRLFKDERPTHPNIVSTLGNGDCLYNAVALGIERNEALRDKLQGALSRIDWSRYAVKYPNSVLARQHIHQRSREEQAVMLSTFINDAFQTADDTVVQQRLAPLLRYMTVNYLRFHFGKRDIPLFSEALLCDCASQYQANAMFRDEMHLLYHPFIQAKLNELIHSLHPEDVPQAFAAWFESDGKIKYLDEIEKPATGALDRARWGSELEADTLARLLTTSFTWEKDGGSNQVGCLSGIVRRDGSDGIGQILTRQLIDLNIAETIQLINRENRVSTYVRFKSNAGELLSLHSNVLLLPGESSAHASIKTINQGWLTARQGGLRLTVYDYISEPQYLNRPDLAEQFMRRGILRTDGHYITDGQNCADFMRMITLAQGLARADVERLRKVVHTTQSSMTLRLEGDHWSCVLPAVLSHVTMVEPRSALHI